MPQIVGPPGGDALRHHWGQKYSNIQSLKK